MEQFILTIHKQTTIKHENINISILPPKMGTKNIPNCAKAGLLSMKKTTFDNKMQQLTTKK